ncbi:MAG: hypothetical protein IJO22_06120 [Oscillospiraceae bacterium]|nr:hypothetical protein [Oscillospiraceae bacterium]
MARPLKSKKELKDETLEELEKEQKFFEERERKAAERSAAGSKDELDELNIKEFLDSTADPVKKITEYEPEFFRDEDREKEEESYRGFGKSFLEILEEEEARKNKEKDLIGAKDRKKLAEAEKKKAEQARAYKEADLPGYDLEEKEYEFADYYTQKQRLSDSIYDRYVEGEKWLMSEGEDDIVKGFINNFRSSIGTGVEDFAYWLNDHASWYKPAKKVVEKNTAGKISDMAQRQFANAKAAGANEKYVDLMDSVSKGLGYNALGFKAGNYIQGGAETFDEYRTLREKGYSKEKATKITASKIPLAILSAKADDYLGKNSRVDDVLYGKSGVVDKIDDIIEFENFKKVIGDDFKYDLDSFKKMKYNEPEKWGRINLDYSRRIDLIVHPENTLPNGSIATAEDGKFVKYLFNPQSGDGYPKGNVITDHLGYSKDNWQDMRAEILKKASKYPVRYKGKTIYGDKYEQKMILYGPKNNPANVVVGWIVKPDGSVHLTTAFITDKGDYKK